jgi:hypothetical protein
MFLAPAFLLGLLAIGVPLWLHRVARANPTQYPFASLMLLEASETQRTARRTLRYWLLLATRILLLIVVALAFAGPLIADRIVPRGADDTRLHAIVLDRSLSMQYRDRWPRAIEAAEAVLREARSSDRVMLVTAEGRHVEVLQGSTPASAAGALRATLRTLQPGIERLDYGLAMSTANSWLGSPRPPVVLHVISDLQRSAAPLRFADLEPPARAQLVLEDVGGDRAENVYIERAALGSVDTRTLDVTVRSNAAQPQQREAIVRIDGREFARKPVRLEATQPPAVISTIGGEGDARARHESEPGASVATNTSQTVAFPDLKLAAGTHRIEVVLEPHDALPQDDRYYAVVEHAEPGALLVANEANADAAAYFSAAIGSIGAPKISIEPRNAAALSGALSGYSIIVVTDAASLPESVAKRIKEYVAAGGAVLATLGGDSSASSTELLEGLRVGAARAKTVRIGEIATTHPVLREAGEWHRVRFFRQHVVQVTDADRVLMTQEDGAPLLVERAIGAGRVLLLTAPIDRSWNDLAVHPLFVQFIADATRYLLGPDAAAASSTVGSVVMTGLTAAAGGQIFDPQGKRVLGLAQTSAADRLIPDQAGFYEIRSGAGVRWLAVNVDARESDLTPLPGAFVQRWQAMRTAPPPQATAEEAPAAQPRSLGTSLLWLAAVLLLAEMLLANRYLVVRREVPK